jgi:hypothetical protein
MSQYFTPAIPPAAGNWSFNTEAYNGNLYIPLVATGYTQIKVVNIADPSIISYINLPFTPSALTISAARNTLYWLAYGGTYAMYKIDLGNPAFPSVPLTAISGLNLPTGIYIDDPSDAIYIANSGNNQVVLVNATTEQFSPGASALVGVGRTQSFTPFNGDIFFLGGASGACQVTPNVDPALITRVVIATATDLADPTKGGVPGGQTWALFIEEYSPGLYYMYFTAKELIPTFPGGAFIRFDYDPAVTDPALFDYASRTVFGLPETYYPYLSGSLFHTDGYLYQSTSNYVIKMPMPLNSSTIDPPVPFDYPCFKAGTKILTKSGYRNIEDIRRGDLIETHASGFKPVCMIGSREIHHPASSDRIKNQLYTYSNAACSEIFEDLVVTGCHSVLVSEFASKDQRAATEEVLGNIYITENKYRLPACVDNRSTVYDTAGDYTIYHVALEHDDYYMNYGIFANGLLVESCSRRYLKEMSLMTLIE